MFRRKVQQRRSTFKPAVLIHFHFTAGNRWRSRHRQVSLDAENEQTESSLKETLRAAEPLPDQSLQTEERADAVRKAVAALPEELKQPLILAVYQDLPQSEIATILKCSVKAVGTRIYRARQQLRTALAGLMSSL